MKYTVFKSLECAVALWLSMSHSHMLLSYEVTQYRLLQVDLHISNPIWSNRLNQILTNIETGFFAIFG